ncbi:uncharacterized protein LOC143234825 [Tachypleus tridentatus]|uniref:uncharacterized protein LOC143234825 n=1 Tax=Tachypleus tridentatus TaxID=6853 RepID=UPI003FD465B2
MDEPSQRFQTTAVKNTNNPFWDEQFLFIVKNSSAEILFEVYDREKNSRGTERFLGLGIIGVKELINKRSERIIMPLHSQPIVNDTVTGSLTVEFTFMDGAEVPVTSDTSEESRELVESNSKITEGGTVITTTTFRTSRGLEGSDETLVDTDLQNFDSKKKAGSPSMVDDNTLIIHSIRGEVIRPVLKVKLDKNGRWREVSQAEEIIDSSATPPCSRLPETDQTAVGETISSSESEKEEGNIYLSSVERGRRRDRRSFMGTLRRRLSFKKNRSRSVEQKIKTPESISRESSRSLSVDRNKSIPGSRESSSNRSSAGNAFLDVPGLARDGNSSARSSISEDSDISASSTRTYIHENSTLVVETNENGVLKHYIIPGSLANRSKWGKRGTKLHIYNDHIFVAKHLSGSTVCEVCGKHLSRRPGKQGYKCRDCNMLCHKSCHVQVESYCPYSSINTIDMEYVQDSRTRSKSS